jgi:hypothetical protein
MEQQNTLAADHQAPPAAKKNGGFRPGAGRKKSVVALHEKGMGIAIYVPVSKVKYVQNLIAELKKQWKEEAESML